MFSDDEAQKGRSVKQCVEFFFFGPCEHARLPAICDSVFKRVSAEFENIFAQISDSKRDLNGFPDPAIAGLRIHQYFGPGFWTLRVIKIFLPRFRIQGDSGRADLVNKL